MLEITTMKLIGCLMLTFMFIIPGIHLQHVQLYNNSNKVRGLVIRKLIFTELLASNIKIIKFFATMDVK